MYRYRDSQGHPQRIGDEAELRAAIADGRIRSVTPFAADGEDWTAAGRHPAFQCHGGPAQRTSLFGSISSNPRYRKFARVAGPLLALALGVYARRGDFSSGDHEAFMAAVFAAATGGALPAEILASPPRRPADRVVWVVLTAAHDAGVEMAAVEERHGVSRTPDDWMQPGYLLHASRYPHVARYFEAAQRYHATYRDSLIVVAERAIRQRATIAELEVAELSALLELVTAEAVPDVEVTLSGADGAASVRTNEIGHFLLTGVHPGECQVTFVVPDGYTLARGQDTTIGPFHVSADRSPFSPVFIRST